MSKVEVDNEAGLYIFQCPHCSHYVQVGKNEVNCTIFRHGYFFREENGKVILTDQMNPHTPKNLCDKYAEEGKIKGCGKPFRMVSRREGYEVEKCDYI
jgi:hypothetical protein